MIAKIVTTLQNKKKFLFSGEEGSTHFLEFRRIRTFQTLHQGVKGKPAKQYYRRLF